MKREFLQNFKVGDQPLPKEVVDAIMAENGRDIEAAKKPYADYETIKGQLSEAQKTIKTIQDQGTDIETARQSAKNWETKYNKAIADHKQEMADMAFDRVLESAITGAHGRNAKAIKALLDMDALRGSKNQTEDMKAALESLKKENSYLFEDEKTPPPVAAGTGRMNAGSPNKPETLLSALEERYKKG